LINDDAVLNGIIVDLRIAIDQLSVASIRAKNLILDFAQKLDELGKCEKSEISTKIKEILADQINGNKISSKWIEECLPRKYKRKYTRKSELSSLSKKTDGKVQDSDVIDTIDNDDGSALLINHDTGHSDSSDNNRENTATDVASSRGFEIQEFETSIDNTDPYQILKDENRELREALKRPTKMVMGDQIPATETEFKIPKEKYNEIKQAMVDSKYFCSMTFDKSRIMVRAVPDIFKTN
jgi:hypothetical protein